MEKTNDRELPFRCLYECYSRGKAFDPSSVREDLSDLALASIEGTLTYSYSIDQIILERTGKDVRSMDDITAVLVRYGAWQILFSVKIPDYAAVDTTVALAKKYSKKSAGFVNAVLRRLTEIPEEERTLEGRRPEIETGIKPELFGILKKSFGRDKALSVARAFLKVPPLTVRFDPTLIGKEDLIKKASELGMEVSGGSFMPECINIVSGRNLLIKSGLFEKERLFIQGEGAMLASHIADPKEGQRILDCCSAPGGKTTHMAALSGGKADITALELKENRAEKTIRNVERLGITCVSHVTGDARSYRAKSPFDTVLIDAPCSGMGLLGSKPDIRVLLTYEKVMELTAIQKDILDNMAENVAPGGRLIYCTCSVNREENDVQFDSFLDRHGDFCADDITHFIPSDIIIDSERAEGLRRGRITLLPDSDGCEGFFIAAARRRDG